MNKSVYIVTKTLPLQVKNPNAIVDFKTNEAVFKTEDAAKSYVEARMAHKDRDDYGCTFQIEPWMVQD